MLYAWPVYGVCVLVPAASLPGVRSCGTKLVRRHHCVRSSHSTVGESCSGLDETSPSRKDACAQQQATEAGNWTPCYGPPLGSLYTFGRVCPFRPRGCRLYVHHACIILLLAMTARRAAVSLQTQLARAVCGNILSTANVDDE